MEIYISNTGDKPIYAQITEQIKAKILSGELCSGDALPSIRLLAKELRISVITTVPGTGSFVAAQDPELLREDTLRRVEGHLQAALDAARAGGVTDAEVAETLSLLMEGDSYGEPVGGSEPV